MKKIELVDIYMKNAKILFKEEAKRQVEIFIESMKEALAKDETLVIRGFGTFERRETKRREGRNPRTGEKVQCTPKKYIKFRVGRDLEDRINSPKRKKNK